MKKLMLSCLFLLGISLVSFAQNQHNGNHANKEAKTPEEHAEMKTQKLTKELSLTPDQAAKVKPVILKEHQSMEQIKTKYANSSDKTAMKSEMKPVREQADAELKAIFTPDQYTKYQEIKKQHQSEHHGGEHHGGGMH